MRKELKTVLRGGAAVLCAGGMYYLLCRFTPFSIPCIFLTLFGIYCPGCGITRMMMYILELDFPAAAASNPFLFVSLPFLAVFFAAGPMSILWTKKVEILC